MPKITRVLTVMAVAKLRQDGLHAVGGAPGLYLHIRGNSRSWILRIVIGGKRRDVGLGGYLDMPLAAAREKAREFRAQLHDGIDPMAERKAAARARLESAQSKTFEECAVAYIKANRTGWVPKHALRYENSLASYTYPVIGKLPVADIDTHLVLEVLQQPVATSDGTTPLWNAKTDTAARLRGRIESILDWAKVSGLRQGDNPAAWKILQHTLPAKHRVRKVEHFAALPYAEVGAFVTELRRREGMAARALEFLILTAARSGEVRGATWDEIDMTARLWTIPAERMKMGKEHRVPLSATAAKLLESLPRLRENGGRNNHIFPAPRGGTMSDMSFMAVLRRMGHAITAHGFRSTFRDWAGETTAYPREVCEHALAHKLADGVEAAYQRGDLLSKRRGLMEAWARHCDTAPKELSNKSIYNW